MITGKIWLLILILVLACAGVVGLANLPLNTVLSPGNTEAQTQRDQAAALRENEAGINHPVTATGGANGNAGP